jgi:hypothetical protein
MCHSVTCIQLYRILWWWLRLPRTHSPCDPDSTTGGGYQVPVLQVKARLGDFTSVSEGQINYSSENTLGARHLDGHWWLIPIILAIQEAEIKRIVVRSQSGQIVHKTLCRKYRTQKRTSRVARSPKFKP